MQKVVKRNAKMTNQECEDFRDHFYPYARKNIGILNSIKNKKPMVLPYRCLRCNGGLRLQYNNKGQPFVGCLNGLPSKTDRCGFKCAIESNKGNSTYKIMDLFKPVVKLDLTSSFEDNGDYNGTLSVKVFTFGRPVGNDDLQKLVLEQIRKTCDNTLNKMDK